MSEAPMTAPPSLDFEQAIQFTRFLLERIENGEIKGPALQAAVAGVAGTRDGARGFFVAYLTDPRPLADRPPAEILRGLRSAPAVIPELLAKNLVMSAAQALVHRQRDDRENAEGSERVCRRSAELIALLDMPAVWQALSELLQSLRSGEGTYQGFLERWHYTVRQKAHMREVVEAVLEEKKIAV